MNILLSPVKGTGSGKLVQDLYWQYARGNLPSELRLPEYYAGNNAHSTGEVLCSFPFAQNFSDDRNTNCSAVSDHIGSVHPKLSLCHYEQMAAHKSMPIPPRHDDGHAHGHQPTAIIP